MKTYWEKLKDPRWQKKRLEVLQDHDFSCEVCGDGTSTLHVHHKQYFKGREPWEYETDQLAVLCEGCHESHHESEDELNLVCSFLPMDGPDSRDTIAALVAGYANLSPPKPYDPFAYYAGILAAQLFARYALNIHDVIDLATLSDTDAKGMFDALMEYAKNKGNKA